MNVREQGTGGLLMLFASGAVLVHLDDLHPRLFGTPDHWWVVLSLFVVALMFVALALFKLQQWRNGLGFGLGAVILFALLGLYAQRVGGEQLAVEGYLAYRHDYSRYRSERLAQDYAAARRFMDGVNPYAGAYRGEAPAAGGDSLGDLGGDSLGDSLGDLGGDSLGDSLGDLGGDSLGDLGGDNLGDLGGDSAAGGPRKDKEKGKDGAESGDGKGEKGEDAEEAKAPTDTPIELVKYAQGEVAGYYTRPAGGFLLYVPLAAFDGDQRVDPRYFEMALLILTVLVLGQALGRQFFFLPMLLVLSLPIFLRQVLHGDTSFAWLCFTCLAWVVAPQRYLSGLFLGLACAIDPQAWFVAPFLVGITGREVDGKTAGLQLTVILAVFFAVNGYWVYNFWGDWSQALSDGLFTFTREMQRDSIGLVMLEDAEKVGTLDAGSATPYWLIVGFLTLMGLVIYLLFPIALYALGPVLGVLPFWAFFRSPAALFYALPLLAMSGWASARIHPPHERYVEPEGGMHGHGRY